MKSEHVQPRSKTVKALVDTVTHASAMIYILVHITTTREHMHACLHTQLTSPEDTRAVALPRNSKYRGLVACVRTCPAELRRNAMRQVHGERGQLREHAVIAIHADLVATRMHAV